jgi:hypothetical protein
MDIYEALWTTSAMRRMKPDPIPNEVQARILDAAIHAPTIGEEWRFILLDDPQDKGSTCTTVERWLKQLALAAIVSGSGTHPFQSLPLSDPSSHSTSRTPLRSPPLIARFMLARLQCRCWV